MVADGSGKKGHKRKPGSDHQFRWMVFPAIVSLLIPSWLQNFLECLEVLRRSGLFPFHRVEGGNPVGISFVYLVLHDFHGGVNQPVLLGKGFFDHGKGRGYPAVGEKVFLLSSLPVLVQRLLDQERGLFRVDVQFFQLCRVRNDQCCCVSWRGGRRA